MKNKKGFTLIELLCVIALLGVILMIASLSISSIGRKVKERQKTNLIEELKISANEYFNNTGLVQVYIDTLITEGYVEAEDEKKKIYDPVTGNELNCYFFALEDKKITFKKGDCKESNLEVVNTNIKYCLGLNCTPNKIVEDIWLNSEDITLGIDSEEKAITWINPLSPDVVHKGQYYQVEIPDNNYINEVYEVIIKKGNTEYRQSARLKVDLISPEVVSLSATDIDKYTKSKTITATIKDDESGLKGYAITTSIDEPSSWTNITGTNQTIMQEVSKEDDYYIWVKDAAGNTNVKKIKDNYISIRYIDNEKPICVYDGENTKWTADDVTITWGCQDDKAGCHEKYSGSETIYQKSTRTGIISVYTIMDNAGNINECPEKEVDVYLDKDAPVISSFVVASTKEYNSKYVNIKVVSTDAFSGVSKVCITSQDNSSNCNWQSFTLVENEANTYKTTYELDVDDGSGDEVTLYVFVKDNVGNIANKSANYTLYTACSKTKIISYGQWGKCDKTCGPGKKYRDVNYGDYYLGTYCSTTENGSNDDCNMGACCDEGTYSCSCNSSGYNVCTRYNGCLKKDEQYTASCTSNRSQYYYNGCNKYYITTCTNGTCSYIEKNGIPQNGTILASSLSSSLGSECKTPTCPAYITTKSGTIVTYTMGNSCIVSSYTTGSCADKGKVGSTGFKVDFSSLSSCTIYANRYKTATWGDDYRYESSWTTHKCSSGERANCYCTGTTASSACTKKNTACVC